jgi:pentatricopeptide repeat protein
MAWFYKGVTLDKLGRHEEGLACYDRVIDINPFHAKAWFNKGATLGNLGRYREALACFEEAHRQGHPRASDAADQCREMLGLHG